jgi:hypothetical protein
MRFEFQSNEKILNVSVIYRPQEGSFDVETSHASLPSAFTSVQVNELQLQLDEQGRVLYADGYCPHFGWCETRATPPSASRAALFVRDVNFVAGVSVAISTSRWPVSVNRKMGWVCIGEQLPSASCIAVEFATGSIALVDGGALKSVWLKPTALPA